MHAFGLWLRAGRALAVSSMVVLGGCAYLEPYVAVNPTIALPPVEESPPLRSLPNVSKASLFLDAWQKDAESKRQRLSLTHRTLNVATFGLAAGSVIAPVYNAYKDLITALAIGAGVTYTSNTLFFPADQISLYGAASNALTCLQTRAENITSAVAPDWTLAIIVGRFDEFQRDLPPSCKQSSEYLQLETNYVAAKDSLRRTFDSDYAAGQKLRSAGKNIVDALNEEIDKRAASSEAILAAAKSLVPLNVPPSLLPAAPPKGKPTPEGLVEPCSAEAIARIKAEAIAYGDKRRALDDALEAINDLGTACALKTTPVADLSVSQETATLSPGVHINLTIAGGRAPYTCTWEGESPSTNGIDARMASPSVCALSATDGLKKSNTYKLTIRDSSIAGRQKQVAVTARPAT